MTPETGFLHALHAEPNDLLTFGVFADWLEEAGDARAPLLRALARLRETAAPAERLSEAEELLVGPAGARLRRLKVAGAVRPDPRGILRLKVTAAPPEDALDRPEWGWITEIELTRIAAVRRLGELLARLPLLRRVTLRPGQGQLGNLRWGQLVAAGVTRPVSLRLELSGQMWNPHHFGPFLATLPPGMLHELAWPLAIHDTWVAAMIRTPGLGSLRRLELSQNTIGPTGAQAIAAAPLPALEYLALERTYIGDAGLLALLDAPSLPALRELRLANTNLSRTGYAALLRSRCGPPPLGDFDYGPTHHLRRTSPPEGPRVEVTGPALSSESWAGHFLGLALPDGVHSLALTHLPQVHPGDLANILALPALARLRSLHLACSGLLNAACLRELLASAVAQGLQALTLHPTGLQPESYAALVASSLFATVQALDVRSVGPVGLQLTSAPGRVELSLQRPSLPLLNALNGTAGRLTHLRVDTPSVERAMRAIALLPRQAESFTLEGCRPTEEALAEVLAALPTNGRLRAVGLPVDHLPADSPARVEYHRRYPPAEG